MTVESEYTPARHQGNGVATIFPYTFEIPDSSYAIVSLQLIADGSLTQLTPSQYLLSGVGVPEGGSVTYPLTGSALASTYTIIIERIVPYIQPVDIVNQGGFYPETLEEQLDLTVMQIQQLVDPINRAIKVPQGETAFTLPSAAARAGLFFAFDANGDFVGTAGTGADGALRTDLASTDGANLVLFTPSGTDVFSRSVQDRLKDYVSILDYIPVSEHEGIRAETSTYDCAAAFQNAVDDAMTVFVPNGKYFIGTTVREATSDGERRVFGQNRHHTKIFATPALAASGLPMFWFGNSTSNATYRLDFSYVTLDGGDLAGEGVAGAIGLRAHQCGLSYVGDMVVWGCAIAIEAIGCIASSFGGNKTELYASVSGFKFTAPTGGATPGSTGGNSTTTTESPLTLKTNINHVQNMWMSRVHRPVRVEGGLTQVEHIVLQNCGNGATDDLITLINANESYDYGGGPNISNVWCEGGNYRIAIRLDNTRDALVEKCFLSGASGNSEQGIVAINSKGWRVRDVAARGAWSRTPSEGRTLNYWFLNDATSTNGIFGGNYFTQNTCTYFVDRSVTTHNNIITDNHRTNNAMNGMVIGNIKISGSAITKDPDLVPAANVTISGFTSIDALTEFRTNGTKVIGGQGAAVANATDAASAITQLNLALARLRAHGLIAT